MAVKMRLYLHDIYDRGEEIEQALEIAARSRWICRSGGVANPCFAARAEGGTR
jgi:hypothetical protein